MRTKLYIYPIFEPYVDYFIYYRTYEKDNIRKLINDFLQKDGLQFYSVVERLNQIGTCLATQYEGMIATCLFIKSLVKPKFYDVYYQYRLIGAYYNYSENCKRIIALNNKHAETLIYQINLAMELRKVHAEEVK
jgi:hypothetical protein